MRSYRAPSPSAARLPCCSRRPRVRRRSSRALRISGPRLRRAPVMSPRRRPREASVRNLSHRRASWCSVTRPRSTLGYALSATAPTGTTVVNGGLFACGLAIATNASGVAPTGPPMTKTCNCVAGRRAVARSRPGGGRRHRARRRRHLPGRALGDAGHLDERPVDRSFFTVVSGVRAEPAPSPGADRHLPRGSTRAVHHGVYECELRFGPHPGPTDSGRRRAIYNGLLDKIASQYPRQVTVVPFGSIVCPSGKFSEFVDGVQVRTPDGVHTPSYSPGNVFAGNSTEAVAERFYGWISPRVCGRDQDPASSP